MIDRTLALPGQRLREAREAAGKSLADVSAALHLSVSYVKALEMDDYERLPEPTFIRGYIRNYARLLSLPGDELANLFQQLINESATGEKEREATRQSSSQKRSDIDKRYWLAGSVVAVLLLAWLAWPDDSSSAAAPTSPASSVIEEIPAGTDRAAELAPAPQLDPSQSDSLAEAADGAALAEAQPVQAMAPVTDTLVLRFAEVCWLRVRDVTGEEIYVGQRDAGATLTLNGQGPFRITLGNAAAVSAIEINQMPVAVPEAVPGQVVTVRAP